MRTPQANEKLTLRLPPKLHQSLKVVAVENGRSLNAEIVQRLLRSLEGITFSDNGPPPIGRHTRPMKEQI
jgi:hypothetical protein